MDPLCLWTRNQLLSRSFWAHYNQVIGPTSFSRDTANHDDYDDDGAVIEADYEHDVQVGQQEAEYLQFIRVTRQHQAERERLKQLELKKNPELNFENYYTDVAQVNTLVEDNLIEAPSADTSKLTDQEKLKQLYGDSYDTIKSKEMWLDEQFNENLQLLSPQYWPAIPLNLKPYLGNETK